MKYSTKCFLIIFLILIVLFTCLGNILQEGFLEGYNNSSKSCNKKKSCRKNKSCNKNKNNDRMGFQGNMALTSHYGNEMAMGYANQSSRNAGLNGIQKRDIPKGQEDLYILKSQIVPPVCPACPPPLLSCKEKKCQPCPPCARCPEPAFDCKKVPNYNSPNKKYLPKPILNSFRQF